MAKRKGPPKKAPYVGREGQGVIPYRDTPGVVVIDHGPGLSPVEWGRWGCPYWVIAQQHQVSEKRTELVFTRTTVRLCDRLIGVLNVVPKCISISAGFISIEEGPKLVPVPWREVKDTEAGKNLVRRRGAKNVQLWYWDRGLSVATVQQYANAADPGQPVELADDQGDDQEEEEPTPAGAA